ncbi:MAG: hypothetical protein A2527_05760 [Candidatus Lambdaproteobacteria bacterium RIFOXYD2_FULL_50_16]|uniref:HprK-related kinase B n=1 Tax=Candidatus Lambdaproteobacteria bacterium RIFOXYD2_FULL_50_16 TaxID=1817772 RepID=A0A1F6G9B7_9PROT|nr:MAG: hypothetical protein A2527_05760 [Candidatus Lambdaproteobacteria bacterium RIFOXYD2_FULL_50_16]
MNYQINHIEELVSPLIADQDFPHSLVLDLIECRIEVKSNSRPLIGKLETYFHAFLSDTRNSDVTVLALESTNLELRVPFEVKQPDPGKTKIKEEFIDLFGGRVIRKRLTGMTFIFGGELNLAVGRCFDNANQVINFVNNRFIAKLLNQNALLGHSAAVKWGNRGMAMAGFSGMGKSTLALQMMSLGASYVSNDRLLIQPLYEGLRMYGVPKLPRINPGTAMNNKDLHGVLSAEDLDRFSQLPKEELWDLEYKHDVFIDECFGKGKFELEGWVDVLVILNWERNNQPLVIEEVKLDQRRDLLRAFMKEPGLFYVPGTIPPDLSAEAYIKAFERVKVMEFSGGADSEAAARVCVELLEKPKG